MPQHLPALHHEADLLGHGDVGQRVAGWPARRCRCLRDAYTLRGHISTNGEVLERAAPVSFGLLEPDMLV